VIRLLYNHAELTCRPSSNQLTSVLSGAI